MIAGDRIHQRSALYLFLGTFAGGGVVLDGRLYRGEQMNAGAIGSMPIVATENGGKHRQLIHQASVLDLERELDAAGFDVSDLFEFTPTASANAIFGRWTQRAVPALAHTIVSASAVIDFQEVVVDGLLCEKWREQIVVGIRKACAQFNHAGLSSFDIEIGSIGPSARVLGAALVPLIRRFSPDTDLLVKTARTLHEPEMTPLSHAQSLPT